MSKPKSEYMLLFRGPHWDEGKAPQELEQAMARVMAWFDDIRAQGKVKAGQPLGAGGRMVSSNGRTVADGPFVESKEAVGGYLLVEVDDLDEATAIARSCPTLEWGITIEVRPVLDECPIFKRARERLFLATA